MVECLSGISVAAYQPSLLHSPNRNWPETNCYVDLLIELLHTVHCDPRAALGFTVLQDFEGDQFTFFKFPQSDLVRLYGMTVQELAVYDSLERHTVQQLQRQHVVLIEVDSFFLPDTAGTTYRTGHGKTTIGVNAIDVHSRELHYFHNAGYYALAGEDFEAIFCSADVLFPYTEFVKLPTSAPANLAERAVGLLKEHLQNRPAHNPILAYRDAFPAHMSELASRPMTYFHAYAFNLLRQLGANFELLASHLEWLSANGQSALQRAQQAAMHIATQTKTLQFQLARAVARNSAHSIEKSLGELSESYDIAIGELVARY